MSTGILVWGHENTLVRRLEQALVHERYHLRVFSDHHQISKRLTQMEYGFLLVDQRIASLRQVIGMIRTLRNYHPEKNILILGDGNHTLEDKIVALENGADDFIAMDVDMRELCARIRRLRQRSAQSLQSETCDPIFIFGGYILDVKHRELIWCDGKKEVALTWHEFELLLCLLEHEGRAVSRNTLACRVHGRVWQYEERSLDVMVSSLRGKLRGFTPHQQLICTVRGVGYHFRGRISSVMRTKS